MIICCCLLTVRVRKKQRIINRAIVTRKIKLARVSNPSQWASSVMGSGKIAIMANMIGNKSQAIEFLMDIELCLRQIIIIIKRMEAAIVISIWRLFTMFLSETYNDN